MKEIGGGAMLAGLFAGAMGQWFAVGIMAAISCLALLASWKTEELKEKQAASWRTNYPSYKYQRRV